MKSTIHRINTAALGLVFAGALASSLPATACTIFVLTDTNHSFFCNNEDWSNAKTRMWFVPGTNNHLGCVFVGFDNGWAQGGMNSKGLAFDWVAGFKEPEWKQTPEMKTTAGNSSETIVESCATVDEAAAFYRRTFEPAFSSAKILVADATGASVIIGSTGGKLTVEQANTCRGFGFGLRKLEQKLAPGSEVSVSNAATILNACRQEGPYATKYSNVFDSRTGDIFVFRFPDQPEGVKLNLATELGKGAHYYDIPELRAQLAEPLRPLLDNMKRLRLAQTTPIVDTDAALTKRLERIVRDAAGGTMKAEDYTAERWKEFSQQQFQIRTSMIAFGEFESLIPVERKTDGDKRSYRYRAEFKNATCLVRFELDKENRIANAAAEDVTPKQN